MATIGVTAASLMGDANASIPTPQIEGVARRCRWCNGDGKFRHSALRWGSARFCAIDRCNSMAL